MISLPFSVSRNSIRILLNGEDVGDAFSNDSDKSVLEGVLNGLALGESVLEVQAPPHKYAGSNAFLTLTNYAIGSASFFL